MQSIERYGVIALLFLVVTVVAVVMWDTEEPESQSTALSAEAARTPAALPATDDARPRAVTDAELQSRTEASAPALAARLALGAEERPAWADPGAAAAEDELDIPALAPEEEREEPLPVRTIAARPAQPSPKPAAARPKGERLHVVSAGETLGAIAQEKLGSARRWPEIVKLNPGLEPASLRVGARLVLPADAAPAAEGARKAEAPASAAAAKGAAPAGRSYRVQSGDSLWRIAERELGDGDRWREIAALNPRMNPDRVLVGAVLALPAGAAPARAKAEDGPSVAKLAPAKAAASAGRVR